MYDKIHYKLKKKKKKKMSLSESIWEVFMIESQDNPSGD